MLVLNYNIEHCFSQWGANREVLRKRMGFDVTNAIPKTHLFGLAQWEEEGGVVATLAIFKNTNLAAGVYLLGGFDCLDQEIGRDFLMAVLQELKNKGAQSLFGPLLGSTWYPYTFQLRGDVILPTEEKHPAWYPEVWQGVGFSVDKDFYHFMLPAIPTVNLQKEIAHLKNSGISIQSKVAYAPHDLASKLYSFLHVAFSKAYLFSPLDWGEFKNMFLPICAARHQGLLWVAEKKEKIIAMVFGMQAPSAAQTYIMKTLARHPSQEYKQLGKIIGLHFMQECKRLGGEKMIFANAREDNFSVFRAKEQGAKKVNIRSLFKMQLL